MTLRPGERASIYLPWRGSSGANYEWLKEVCGARTRPIFDRESKRFLVARPHAQRVLDALVDEYEQVFVVQYGHTATTCVEQCWNARPETVTDCECGCAGANHGSGRPFDREVKDGLAITRQLTKAVYLVSRAGWEFQSSILG